MEISIYSCVGATVVAVQSVQVSVRSAGCLAVDGVAGRWIGNGIMVRYVEDLDGGPAVFGCEGGAGGTMDENVGAA